MASKGAAKRPRTSGRKPARAPVAKKAAPQSDADFAAEVEDPYNLRMAPCKPGGTPASRPRPCVCL